MTKLEATLADDGRSFEDIGAARATEIQKANSQRWGSAGGRSPPTGATDDRRTTDFDLDKAHCDHTGSDRGGSHE